MFLNKSKSNELNNKIEKLNNTLNKSQIVELSELLGNKKQILVRNLMSGISKGIGMGIGFTIITAIIISILQKIVTLNIPVIGEYVSDIIEIVQHK